MNDIKKLEDTSLVENINSAKISVLSATEPKQLLDSVIALKLAKDTLKSAKMELKEITKEPTKIIKRIDTLLKELETDIKDKVLETFESKEIVKQYEDEETGEITFKTFENRNLGKGLFTYAEEKKVMVVDTKAITQKDYPQLFKQVWVIDNEKLKSFDRSKLPMTEKITNARVGIQFASVGKKLLLGDK